jgi:RNA polymerase sigma factor (TIGR02999 family)
MTDDPVQSFATARRIGDVLARGTAARATAETLLPLVYEELRELARARVRRLANGYTMRATELVHEAWLRVVKGGDPGWDGRAHFFGAAANAMRNILVEQARRRFAQKRDAGRKEALDDEQADVEVGLPPEDVIALHDALGEFEVVHARAAKVVELRFFGGLEMADIAKVVDASLPTVERDWRFARAWLQDKMGGRELTDG